MTVKDDREQIHAVVRGFILNEFLLGETPDNLSDSTRLISGGIVDSVGVTRLVLFLEDRFGVEIQTAEVNADYLDTVDLIVNMVAEKLAIK